MSSAILAAALALTVPVTVFESKTLTQTCFLFCLYFLFLTDYIRDGVTEPRGRSVAKEEHSTQGECACVFCVGRWHMC